MQWAGYLKKEDMSINADVHDDSLEWKIPIFREADSASSLPCGTLNHFLQVDFF